MQGKNILDELKPFKFQSPDHNLNKDNNHHNNGEDHEEEKTEKDEENNRLTLNSPDKKKRNNIPEALGETLVSELIQDVLLEKDLSSKSSRGSSRVDLSSFINNPEVSPLVQNPQFNLQYMEEYSQSSVDEDLKNSDLKALLLKRERQAHKPVRFNVMVVGESGLGKSTFIDAFLDTKYHSNQQIRPSTKNIVEREGTRMYNGIMLKMSFIDTPGYGANLDVTEWYKIVKGYIIKQFENFKEEKKKRQKDKKISLNSYLEDRRVHALLYFIAGPRINQKDLIYMKRLKKYVNIIPVLAKGDSYTVNEIKEMKLNLIREAHDYKIEWFDFAEALKDSPAKLKEVTEGKFGPSPPFLLISSLSKIKIAPNEYVYGREYTWGVCNIENPNHSDFTLLQTLLGGHICLEAIQLTHFFYKDYFKKLKEKRKNEEEEEKKRNMGVGALVAFGIFGALFAIKKKILNS